MSGWRFSDLDPELLAGFESGGLNQVCVACGCIEPARVECSRCGTDSDPDTWHWRGELEQ